MKTAIFGPPGSGKTELFLALAPSADTRDGRAMVKVPEPRLDPLQEMFQPQKKTPPEREYVDSAGGSGKERGVGRRVLSEARPCDCLLAVLDGFSGFFDPEKQWQEVETELIISDLEVAEKRLERIQADKKKAKDLADPEEEELLNLARQQLEQERPLREEAELASARKLRGYRFLSAKPILYVWNVAESALDSFSTPSEGRSQVHLALSAKLERELAEIDDPQEREAFFQDLGLMDSARERVISATFRLLGLITFLTVERKEARAWTLSQGSTAYEAAGVVHSDIQRGFIRAEVLNWQDFQRLGGFKQAKEQGVLRLEGKDYLVQDGDIIQFRFNI